MSVQTQIQPAAPPVESDEALMLRLRDGEAAAGDVLVQRYYAPLLRYLSRLAGSQMAEELLQQTWLSVLDHAGKFDPQAGGGSFKAWVFRIATNKVNDHWRSRGRDRNAREAMKLQFEETAPHAGHRLEGTEQEQKLKKAMAQLPENQRQVLMLRYYSGMKFVEIAELLGCPLNTALGRVHKAMLKLRQLLNDE